MTKTKKPKNIKAFQATIQDCKNRMNFSYGEDTQDDGNGNPVQVFLWVSGDWMVKYKDKRYLIPMSENVNALIEWINEQEKRP